YRSQLDRARRGVDRVVNERELAVGRGRAVRIRQTGLDFERVLGYRSADCTEVLLRNGEVQINRADLIDDDQRIGVVGLHHVAELDHNLSGAPVDWRANRG